jgi:hypothetical protein
MMKFALVLAVALFAGRAVAETPLIDPALKPDQIKAIGEEAFYWGLNQAEYYELRYQFTQNRDSRMFRGLNKVFINRHLFDAKGSRIATTVNASTLYEGGNFDVSREPMIVLTPKMDGNRYWSIQAADPYADWFFMIGSQFTGNAPQRYVIVGPHWNGKLPDGFRGTEVIRATADSFSITLRIAVTNRDKADFEDTYRFMEGVSMMPLSMWERAGRKPVPLADQPTVEASYPFFPRMKDIADTAKAMTAMDYYQLLSLALNDPTITKRTDSVKEVETLKRLARIGLKEGVHFDPSKLSAEQAKLLEAAFAEARVKARTAMNAALRDMNGWKLQSSLFYDDNDYPARAGAVDVAWGTPVPYKSHTIGYVFDDAVGRKLDGARKYTLTFDVKNLPPVTEFWELPVYDAFGYFVDNPVNRYSATSYLFQAGAYAVKDGKLTFYLQSTPPADPDRARNWLPTPASGNFQLAARFYGPTTPLIDGSYPMPRIVETK